VLGPNGLGPKCLGPKCPSGPKCLGPKCLSAEASGPKCLGRRRRASGEGEGSWRGGDVCRRGRSSASTVPSRGTRCGPRFRLPRSLVWRRTRVVKSTFLARQGAENPPLIAQRVSTRTRPAPLHSRVGGNRSAPAGPRVRAGRHFHQQPVRGERLSPKQSTAWTTGPQMPDGGCVTSSLLSQQGRPPGLRGICRTDGGPARRRASSAKPPVLSRARDPRLFGGLYRVAIVFTAFLRAPSAGLPGGRAARAALCARCRFNASIDAPALHDIGQLTRMLFRARTRGFVRCSDGAGSRHWVRFTRQLLRGVFTATPIMSACRRVASAFTPARTAPLSRGSTAEAGAG